MDQVTARGQDGAYLVLGEARFDRYSMRAEENNRAHQSRRDREAAE